MKYEPENDPSILKSIGLLILMPILIPFSVLGAAGIAIWHMFRHPVDFIKSEKYAPGEVQEGDNY